MNTQSQCKKENTMINYFLKVVETTNVTQPMVFVQEDLAGVIPWQDKLSAGHQGELSHSKTSPSPAAPPLRVLPCFQAWKGRKKRFILV